MFPIPKGEGSIIVLGAESTDFYYPTICCQSQCTEFDQTCFLRGEKELIRFGDPTLFSRSTLNFEMSYFDPNTQPAHDVNTPSHRR